jgi:hypothetical protein
MSNVALFNGAAVPAFAKKAELSAIAKALSGGGVGGGKRISIKGGVFRLVDSGKEVAAIEERYLDVVIVNAAPKVSRVFYAKTYDANAVTAPDCWSADGEKPSADSENKQATNCAECPKNIAGSGQGNSRACRYQQRLAVVLANDVDGDVLQLALPATSIFGKAVGDDRPLQEYARYLAAQTINPETVVTRMKFDTKSESPKLFFKPMRWLSDDEYESVEKQAKSDDAIKAITMTVAKMDNAATAEPAPLGGTPPKAAAKPAPQAEPEAEEEPPVAPPKAKKAKAAPAAAAEDEGEEPVVRKEEAKPTAVPTKKSSLAAAVSDWDDE